MPLLLSLLSIATFGCGGQTNTTAGGPEVKAPFDPGRIPPPGEKADQFTSLTQIVGTLAYRQTATGTLPRERFDGYKIAAARDDIVSLFLTAVPRSRQFDPVVLLYGPIEAGNQVFDNPLILSDDIGPANLNSHVVGLRIPETGTYLAVVAEYRKQPMRYRLRVACSSPNCRPQWTAVAKSSCTLSPLAETVHRATLAADQSRNPVPSERVLTLRNAAGPPLIDGPTIFPVFADYLAAANHEADIEVFEIEESDSFQELLDGLARLESRLRTQGRFGNPVLIRFLVDSMKYFPATTQLSEVAAKQILGPLDSLALDPSLVQVELSTFEHITFGGMHTKQVVIDGRILLIGGANLQDHHDYEAPWNDSWYVFKGEVAGTMLADFDHAWAASVRFECSPGTDGALDCARAKNDRPPSHAPEVLSPTWDQDLPRDVCLPLIALNRTAWGGYNNNVDNPMDQGFLAAMNNAQKTLRIRTPNLSDDAVRDAVVGAVGRGVDVQIILALGFNELIQMVPGQGGTNSENVRILYDRVAQELPAEYRAGLKIRWYSFDGVAPVNGNGPRASHFKYLSIDGRMAIVGSANMETQSWNHSREANVAVDSPDVTANWDEDVFTPAWERSIPAEDLDP